MAERPVDVLIVGGGIIGCAIAHFLTRAGASVTIVERRRIGQEASWAAAGVLAPPKPSALPLEHARLEKRSFDAYPAFVAEVAAFTGLSVDYVPSGQLAVALDERDEAALRAALPWQRDLGLAAEWLDGDEVRRREPAVGPAARGAVWFPEVGSVRAHRLTEALARAAVLRGATILEDSPVLELLRDGDRITGARTAHGAVHAAATVLATGAWTAHLGAPLGLALPTAPVRGQMLALAGATPPLRRIVAGGGGYLVPRADGLVAVAATVEEAGFDARVTPEGLRWLANLIGALAPSLLEARVVETWAGLRPRSGDDAPLLGRAPGYEGLWVAAGHFRLGILWAPVTGELLADSILRGRPAPELAPYDPARFLPNAAVDRNIGVGHGVQ